MHESSSVGIVESGIFFPNFSGTFFLASFFSFFGMGDEAVALALVQLATPQRAIARAQRNSHDSDVSPNVTLTPHGSPIRHFKLSHVKRPREELLMFTYSTGEESMEIPFTRDEEASAFYDRREKAARILFDTNRKDVYCTWRKTLLNIVIESPHWKLFKKSVHQKRYCHGSIQLVEVRYTCSQWKDHDISCRNCQNRTWRVGCVTPMLLYFVLPMQNTASVMNDLLENDLCAFEPIDVQRDTSAWETRVPPTVCR